MQVWAADALSGSLRQSMLRPLATTKPALRSYLAYHVQIATNYRCCYHGQARPHVKQEAKQGASIQDIRNIGIIAHVDAVGLLSSGALSLCVSGANEF